MPLFISYYPNIIAYHPQNSEVMGDDKTPSDSSSSPPPPAPKLTHQIHGSDDLGKVYSKLDANGDGKLSVGELETALHVLGNEKDTAFDAECLMQTADTDGDGLLGLDEFKSLIRSGADDGKCLEDLKQAFAVYDRDGKGKITAKDLHNVMGQVMPDKITLADCEKMVQAVDKNNDGVVGFDEFFIMMTRSGEV